MEVGGCGCGGVECRVGREGHRECESAVWGVRGRGIENVKVQCRVGREGHRECESAV